MEVQNKELKDLCDLIECGIFMFMKKYQENKSLTIKEYNSFLSDVTKLSKETDFSLVQYKVLRMKRNWNLLSKSYNEDTNITPAEISFVKLITDRFNNTFIETQNECINSYSELDEDEIKTNNDSINECIEYFMEKINDEESHKSINTSLDKLKELENYLELFEFCNIDSVSEELENSQTLWNVFSELYEKLENDVFVSEQIQIIKEMFETILTVVEDSFFQNVKIDESILSNLENAVNQFNENVTNNFFEKKLQKLQIPMTDGRSAYKLVDGIVSIGGNIISYLSEDKYYNQNRKLIESGKIHPVNLKFHNDKVFWDEQDKWGSLEKRNGKVCVIDITPEVMNDFDCAFELSKAETIRIETGESIKNIKYIAINRKLYDKDKDPIYINQSCFYEISVDNEFISFAYDGEKYKFSLAKKYPSSTMSRKEIDAIEYSNLKNELERQYHKIESKITEYTSKLDEQSEEYYRLKDILANLESSRKRYMQ